MGITITDELLWAILKDELSDAEANALVWQALGYVWDEAQSCWKTDLVAPEWRQDYPEPPDFIASRPATVKLTRSIPAPYKQLLKEELGFAGYSINELVPRKTRRATMTNWLLAYRRSQQD
ncbi:DUF1823 family protein [Synechococcus elongatus]|uniref:DUF1823 domain-containing protein n=2 Tax=Synechococcus elongatus TaxID=32046 RepID=Q31RK1_SYNE7|nr:DUF1823 family protein [Synechococcus elongatus]2L1N_A Chain A, Uncharacterized protein [Synechococcus elongatus PCC 7942 = FACHB-805]ABB56318.1 conserved hypothetical protein [Synechococcus elongatus PCC 7942 = FACHB-805]MBD2588151.1 DUF1823 family protein [Synechococcus elongatus FACHB-242]MBD2689219.1 DUF1823 family protein [Synechococcus elongatus FACHB-1061]MBD2707141.1 DUF1823 family protein [Synechococcus elongatus PCC 7942 = FACHB-805]UOW70069.1 protein of unknown function DUF1823 